MQKELVFDGARLWNKIDGYLSKALKSDLFKHRAFDPHSLRLINIYMVVIIILLSIYMIIDIIVVNPARKAISMASGSSASGASQSLAQTTLPVEMNNYSYYSNKMPGRNIFTANPYAESEYLTGSGEVLDDSVGLVGIVSGNDPQVIIEDKKSQQTYYIKKGQAINGITVEDISEGRVSLDCRGKKMTLSL